MIILTALSTDSHWWSYQRMAQTSASLCLWQRL